MNTTYKSNNNIVYSCKYHVVWCPKYRRKVLTNGVDVRLKELLTEYAAGSRSSAGNPQSCKIFQRLYVQDLKTGISVSGNCQGSCQ